MRVPDYPASFGRPIALVSEYRSAGYVLISHCSSGNGHQHQIDYDHVLNLFGDVEIDFAFKQAMTCPVCGCAGGGLTISPGQCPGA